MKYNINCKVYSFVFSNMLKDYYKKNHPETDIKNIIRDLKKEYKEMIIRTPGLSRDNNMAGNLKGAAYFFAMAHKIPGMTPDEMNNIIDESFKSDFMQKSGRSKRKKGTLFSEKEQDKMLRDSIRSQSSEDEMDWKYTYKKGSDEIFYTITKCGVCRLAEREDCLSFLPCMCRMDYPKYNLMGGKLIRHKTLANNDDCCDFHIVKIKE